MCRSSVAFRRSDRAANGGPARRAPLEAVAALFAPRFRLNAGLRRFPAQAEAFRPGRSARSEALPCSVSGCRAFQRVQPQALQGLSAGRRRRGTRAVWGLRSPTGRGGAGRSWRGARGGPGLLHDSCAPCAVPRSLPGTAQAEGVRGAKRSPARREAGSRATPWRGGFGNLAVPDRKGRWPAAPPCRKVRKPAGFRIRPAGRKRLLVNLSFAFSRVVFLFSLPFCCSRPICPPSLSRLSPESQGYLPGVSMPLYLHQPFKAPLSPRSGSNYPSSRKVPNFAVTEGFKYNRYKVLIRSWLKGAVEALDQEKARDRAHSRKIRGS